MNFDLVLGQMLFQYCQLESRMAVQVTFRLFTLRTRMCTSLNSSIVNSRPE